MSRSCSHLLLALLLSACAPPPDGVPPGPLSDGDTGGAGGAGGSASERPRLSSCLLDGHANAPSDLLECGSGMACDADSDCDQYTDNYCLFDSCAHQGCLRGRCSPNRVQGEPCTRGPECSSGVCDNGVCTPGKGVTFHL